jgi:hypothetical protein
VGYLVSVDNGNTVKSQWGASKKACVYIPSQSVGHGGGWWVGAVDTVGCWTASRNVGKKRWCLAGAIVGCCRREGDSLGKRAQQFAQTPGFVRA